MTCESLAKQIFRNISASPQVAVTYLLDDTITVLLKQPTRRFDSRISVWFDGDSLPATVFTDDQIKSINVIHELSGSIVTGQLTAILLNHDFELTPSNPESVFYGKFKPGLKVKVELGICRTTQIEWIPMGVYYLDSWNAPSTKNTLTLVAYDRLFPLLESDIQLGDRPARANTTAQIMLVEALAAVGITNLDLTAAQPNIPINIGWFDDTSLRQQVDLLLAAGNFIAFIDKAVDVDVVRILPAGLDVQKRIYRFDSSTVFEVFNPQDYEKARSIVEFTFSNPVVSPAEEVWRGTELVGENRGLKFSDPIAGVEYTQQKGTTYFTVSAGAVSCDILVPSGVVEELKLFGLPIKDYPATTTVTNPLAVQLYGEKIQRKANRFVQNHTLAIHLAEKHLEQISDPTNIFRFTCSGQPALSFNNLIRLQVPEHRANVSTLVLNKIETVYDGGLSLKAEGRRLT